MVRDRVEADLTVCAHFGGALEIAVLRCAEILAPGTGSQLWDYLPAALEQRVMSESSAATPSDSTRRA